MSEVQILLITLWAGLAGFQHRFLGVIHIDRPLVAGMVVGLILGDLPTAMIAAASLELVFIGAQRVGGSVPPNVVIGGTLGVAAAVTTGQGVEAALAVGLPAALIGSAFEVLTKTACSFFVHSSEAYVEAEPRPNTTGISVMVHVGNLLYFLTAAIPVYIALQFGTAAAQAFFASIPASVLAGLSVTGKILPVIGFAILLDMLLTRRMVPFFLLGFVLAAYLKMPSLGIALLGIMAAMIFFEWTGQQAPLQRDVKSVTTTQVVEKAVPIVAGGATDEPLNGHGGRRRVTSGDLTYAFWRSFGLQSAFSFERMQTLGLVWVLMPLLQKLYGHGDELRQALRRHLTFFNTEPILGGSTILGMTIALEEKRANGEPFDDSTINAIKVGLMGPMAGIGDSLVEGLLRVIAATIGIGFAAQGNVLGAIVFLLIFNFFNIGIRWYGLRYAYRLGDRLLEGLQSLQVKRWMEAGTILGLVVVAGLIPQFVSITAPLTYGAGGEQQIKLQDTLDKIMPGLIPLGLTLFSLWLVRRGWNSLWVMLLLVVIGGAAGMTKVLA
jgi:mannose/fructose/N-acetylgalactosamine-specific phosphotransferase system component IID/mannose/fructose/N-acetylgalactosamine-specific phosphotransferase system component IIC